MYDVEKCYVSLMLACKHPHNDNIRNCVARIVGKDKKHVDDYCIMVWLSKAIEEFRPYDRSINSQGICEWLIT